MLPDSDGATPDDRPGRGEMTQEEIDRSIVVIIPRTWPAGVIPKTSGAFNDRVILIKDGKIKTIWLYAKKKKRKSA